jgi:hypothetical protein
MTPLHSQVHSLSTPAVSVQMFDDDSSIDLLLIFSQSIIRIIAVLLVSNRKRTHYIERKLFSKRSEHIR